MTEPEERPIEPEGVSDPLGVLRDVPLEARTKRHFFSGMKWQRLKTINIRHAVVNFGVAGFVGFVTEGNYNPLAWGLIQTLLGDAADVYLNREKPFMEVVADDPGAYVAATIGYTLGGGLAKLVH
ncbi:hypothetical protein ACFL2V_14820 [Pseudomonadota bacterium]